MAKTQCAGVVAARRFRGAVQRWEDDPVKQCDGQRKRSGREDCRLNSIYTPIDMTSSGESVPFNAPHQQVRKAAVIREGVSNSIPH